MHICVGKLTNIGSDNGLSPGRRQAIIWTNAGILLIGTLETNFSEFLIVIHTFSFNKMHLKMSSAKWRPFCLGLNVLTQACFGKGIYIDCMAVYDFPVIPNCVIIPYNKRSRFIQSDAFLISIINKYVIYTTLICAKTIWFINNEAVIFTVQTDTITS